MTRTPKTAGCVFAGIFASSLAPWRYADASVVDALVNAGIAAAAVVFMALSISAVSRWSAWADRWPRWLSGRP